MNKNITIKKPYIEIKNDWAYLKAPVIFPDREETVFFAVRRKYEDCLCAELGDAFVVSALQWCMKEDLNIVSEAPVSRQILFSLRHRLIPEMSYKRRTYHPIKIEAEPSDLVFEGRKNVGLCWSAGSDSLYTLRTHMDAPEGFRVTHIVNINAGVYEEPDMEGKFIRSLDKCARDAEKLGLKDLSMNTNLHLCFPYLYMTVVSTRLAAAFLALQKGFKAGYISSTHAMKSMKFVDYDVTYCEMVVQSSLSNQNVCLRAPGVETSRMGKLEKIVDFTPAQEMLYVCVKEEETNCMRCIKCSNVIASLDAMDQLEKFKKVFDLDYCRSHMDEIWGCVINAADQGVVNHEPLILLEAKGRSPSPRAYRRARILAAADKAAQSHEDVIRENLT